MISTSSIPEGTQRFLGVEIGGTKLQVAVGTASGRIVDIAREAVPAGADGAEIQRIIRATAHELIRRHPVVGIGVGFGGPVDVQSGTIICSHQVDGWEGFSMRAWLEDVCNLPVTVENDANTAALAEARLGAGMHLNPVFYITLGSGVGGGLVIDGRIIHGKPPGESEIGHLRLSPDGPILESVCSGWALDQRLRKAVREAPRGELARLLVGVKSGEAKVLPDALKAGDRRASAALDETAAALAFGLSHVVHIVHPETVVIGGGLAHLGELLLDPLRRHLKSNIMKAMLPAPSLKTASLGEAVVPAGAILLAADRAASEAGSSGWQK